jgi:uncharacterized repeat protein (TIGR03803 family)
MRQEKFWFTVSGILVVLAMALMLPTGAVAASKYKVLRSFTGKNGLYPFGDLIFDGAGNLYGTTEEGGVHKFGTAFKLIPHANGKWTERVLHSFVDLPAAGGLILDASGNLYGQVEDGVFKLAPNEDGTWTESLIASMRLNYANDLISDAAGDIYGEEQLGGNFGYGKIFELTPNSDGTWTENDLYSFDGSDGKTPTGGLIFDAAGNLYGAAVTGGGPPNWGLIFKLTPNLDGSWTESVLYTFTGGKDGAVPSRLILDLAGNLYGTTFSGGNFNCGRSGCGVVFKLDTSGKESVLHAFAGHPAAEPYVCGLIFDGAGNLYGTAEGGGAQNGGAVFKLTPSSDGSWAFSVLHTFQGNPALHPRGGLVIDKAGNLYGTSHDCGSGTGCYGVVFEITP